MTRERTDFRGAIGKWGARSGALHLERVPLWCHPSGSP